MKYKDVLRDNEIDSIDDLIELYYTLANITSEDEASKFLGINAEEIKVLSSQINSNLIALNDK
ncbi:hypothetical protein [Candidatus Deianiraea vastatrix]|uniref:Uncharacterized protein n=1 Tax=Candidatus Deianiraea vastatrix TaxID=2163644 RepID=A0A5B8XBW0_9RICK|nr:hypothetical protein [Candidatus Deianiraea vastatrix]QED22839.1 hypothetical protein Deia_00025 [Candidatus Deianiraea vastatrix]